MNYILLLPLLAFHMSPSVGWVRGSTQMPLWAMASNLPAVVNPTMLIVGGVDNVACRQCCVHDCTSNSWAIPTVWVKRISLDHHKLHPSHLCPKTVGMAHEFEVQSWTQHCLHATLSTPPTINIVGLTTAVSWKPWLTAASGLNPRTHPTDGHVEC